jgi:hypothetical protein
VLEFTPFKNGVPTRRLMGRTEMVSNAGTLTVSGEDPRGATSPTFANFVAVSQVGTEVQFEFIFLDLAQLAVRLERWKAEGGENAGEFQGKTVGKVIVPVATFVQLKEHLLGLMKKLEVQDEQREKTSAEREYGD